MGTRTSCRGWSQGCCSCKPGCSCSQACRRCRRTCTSRRRPSPPRRSCPPPCTCILAAQTRRTPRLRRRRACTSRRSCSRAPASRSFRRSRSPRDRSCRPTQGAALHFVQVAHAVVVGVAQAVARAVVPVLGVDTRPVVVRRRVVVVASLDVHAARELEVVAHPVVRCRTSTLRRSRSPTAGTRTSRRCRAPAGRSCTPRCWCTLQTGCRCRRCPSRTGTREQSTREARPVGASGLKLHADG